MTRRRILFTIRQRTTLQGVFTLLKVLALLYLFLFSIKLMGSSFKSFGEERIYSWLSLANNPFVGLMLGILVTSIVQSSSFTTTTVVTLVASGSLRLECAIPMIMGANIGTTITNSFVAMAHVPRREEFSRAYSAAVLHDYFNLLTVIVLFPIEMMTGYLRRAAGWLAGLLVNVETQTHESILKRILKPLMHVFEEVVIQPLEGRSRALAGSVVLVIALLLLFAVLALFVKVMRSAVFGRVENVLDRIGFDRPVLTLSLGIIITAVVQSSSVTTSLVVPLAGAGLVTLEQTFPFMLGANVGTTVTALIGSLAAGTTPELQMLGITVALAHLLFNVTGILIFYPLKAMRNIPIGLARYVGRVVHGRRYMAPVLTIVIFFVVPVFCILIWKALS